MKHIDFWFDPISPFAYLAFEKLPQTLQGLSYAVRYRPVLFAALLKHHGQLGPAEIAPKRDWTFRHIAWAAQHQGIPLQMPAAHPFNPLPLLRLAAAAAQGGACNRYMAERIFHWVWRSGNDAGDAVRVQALARELQAERQAWDGVAAKDPTSDEVKAQLKANTDEAITLGLFGVPSMVADGKVFWGLDALPMLRAYLSGDTWFDADAWDAPSRMPVGVVRARATP
jgi:2-hydroxychromene-2-carboxylate isomerase